jgi:purine nucleoside phosphorylase
VSALQFQDIMTILKPHLLTKFVKDNLVAMAGGGKHTQKVSYSYFVAFISLLNNMELIRKIFLTSTKGNMSREVTKGNLDLLPAHFVHFDKKSTLHGNFLFVLTLSSCC